LVGILFYLGVFYVAFMSSVTGATGDPTPGPYPT
jgi:hypothetical protein